MKDEYLKKKLHDIWLFKKSKFLKYDNYLESELTLKS